jgi:hypothetical protein
LLRCNEVATGWRLPSLSLKHWLRVSAGVVIVVAALALLVGHAATHPKLTRQQAIQTALKWGDAQPYSRVEAKFMRSSDFAAGTGDTALRPGTSDYFVWVVAVSGRYGISPLGRTTWGIAIIRDDGEPAGISPIFEGGVTGNWPPFFDGLPDLAKDQK